MVMSLQNLIRPRCSCVPRLRAPLEHWDCRSGTTSTTNTSSTTTSTTRLPRSTCDCARSGYAGSSRRMRIGSRPCSDSGRHRTRRIRDIGARFMLSYSSTHCTTHNGANDDNGTDQYSDPPLSPSIPRKGTEGEVTFLVGMFFGQRTSFGVSVAVSKITGGILG